MVGYLYTLHKNNVDALFDFYQEDRPLFKGTRYQQGVGV